MSIGKNIIEELRTSLLQEQKIIEANLSRIAKTIDKKEGDYETSFDDLGQTKEDNATEVELYADNLPVELSLEKKLRDVLDALERIKSGTYGICDRCGKEIAIERLKVNPSARTCTKCK